jgi:hypothetical protein
VAVGLSRRLCHRNKPLEKDTPRKRGMGIFVKQVDDFLLHGDVFVQLADGCNVLIID